MEDGNKELRELNDSRIDKAEIWRDLVVDTIGIYGPLAIPLVPAGLTLSSIGVNYEKLLGFPKLASWSIGGLGGVGIEIFGIIANENYLDMVRYNHTIQPGEELAPVDEAKDARDLYVKIVMGLLTTLEFIPAIAGLVAHYAVKAEAAMQIISTISVLVSLYPLAYLAVLTARVIIMRKQQKARMRVRRNRQEEEDKANVIAELEAKVTVLTSELDGVKFNNKQALDSVKSDADKWQKKAEELSDTVLNLQGRIMELNTVNSVKSEKVTPLKTEPNSVKSEEATLSKKKLGKDERMSELLSRLRKFNTPDQINKSQLAADLGVTRQTIADDIEALVEAKLLTLNGHVDVKG